MIDRDPKFHLAVPHHTHDLNIKATDFALHPQVSIHPGELCCLKTAFVTEYAPLNFFYENRVRSLNLMPSRIFSLNFVQI